MSRTDCEGARAPRVSSTRFRSVVLKGPLTALTVSIAAAALGGCASTQSSVSGGVASTGAPMFPESKWGVSASRRVAGPTERIPKGGGVYKVGEPYQVGGRWYKPREQPDYDRIGTASWYGSDFHGRHTANGEIFDMHAMTAAHPTLPLPSYAYVTNLSNNRTILVRINDRGPYVGDRMIDLSKASADALGLRGRGTGQVRVRYAGAAPLDGNDAREREFAASRPWNGGAHIAALEREQSAREWAAYRNAPPARSPIPPASPPMTASNRTRFQDDAASHGPRYGEGPGIDDRRAYADAGPQQGGTEPWSPERYRAAIASR